MPSTGGTVEIGDKSGFILSTTSTVPVSSQRFIDTTGTLYDQALVDTSKRLILGPSSTVQAVSAPGTGSTVEAHLVDTTATIPVSTVIESAKVGKDTTGTIGYLLTDTSERLITSPSSTVQAVSAPGTGSTVEAHLVDTTSTIPTTAQFFVDSAGTLYSQALVDTSKRVVLAPASTIQVENWPTDYIKTTGGTVEIGDKTGFTLSTTSTVPVSFSTPTDVNLVNTSGTVQVGNFPTTQDVNLVNASGTVNVDLFVDSAGTLYPQSLVDTSKRLVVSPTSTIEIGDKTGFSLSTTSTVPVSFTTPYEVTTTSTISTIISSIEDTTSTRPVSFPPSSTVQAVSALTTAASGTTFAITVTTSTTQLLTSNTSRKGFAVVGNAEWYLGFGTTLTTANGFKLSANQSYTDSGQGVYTGEVWGIVASGTANIRVIETW
ncbi:MAG: hypothetical protein ACTSVW_00360 [Candidatus Njordarchaeales archaeon]